MPPIAPSVRVAFVTSWRTTVCYIAVLKRIISKSLLFFTLVNRIVNSFSYTMVTDVTIIITSAPLSIDINLSTSNPLLSVYASRSRLFVDWKCKAITVLKYISQKKHFVETLSSKCRKWWNEEDTLSKEEKTCISNFFNLSGKKG